MHRQGMALIKIDIRMAVTDIQYSNRVAQWMGMVPYSRRFIYADLALASVILFLGGWLYLNYANNPFMQTSIGEVIQAHGITLGILSGLALLGSGYLLLFYVRDARSSYQIFFAIESAFAVFLSSWLYVDYRANVFMQIYLADFFRTYGVLIGLTVGLGIGLPTYLVARPLRGLVQPSRGRRLAGRTRKSEPPLVSPDDLSRLRDKLRTAEDEIQALQFRLASLRKSNPLVWGGSLLFLGSILLVGAFFTKYLPLEVASIVVIFGGIAMLFKDVERRVSSRLSVGIARASVVAYGEFLKNSLGSERRVEYMPSKDGDPSLVALQDFAPGEISSTGRIGPEVCITGLGLSQMISEELDSGQKDPEYLEEWLPRVLVDVLGLAAEVDMSIRRDRITLSLRDMAFNSLCADKDVSKVCDWIGCPVNSALGAVLAKHLDTGLAPLGCEYDPAKRFTRLTYQVKPKPRPSPDVRVTSKPQLLNR